MLAIENIPTISSSGEHFCASAAETASIPVNNDDFNHMAIRSQFYYCTGQLK
jgi:hypothetical protein